MAISLKTHATGSRAVTAHFGGDHAEVVYRVAERTPAKDAGLDHELLVDCIVRLVESWEILGDDDKPIPLERDAVAVVPTPILRAVLAAIIGDSGLGEARGSSASG